MPEALTQGDEEFFQKAFQGYCLTEIHLHHMVSAYHRKPLLPTSFMWIGSNFRTSSTDSKVRTTLYSVNSTTGKDSLRECTKFPNHGNLLRKTVAAFPRWGTLGNKGKFHIFSVVNQNKQAWILDNKAGLNLVNATTGVGREGGGI